VAFAYSRSDRKAELVLRIQGKAYSFIVWLT
jgi:hypothetical protein